MNAPEAIVDLVERFERNLSSYKSGRYNETQVRLEFINPFFEALGWDVRNERGYAEAYKDVIHEFSLKTADTSEAPDYCFRIGSTRKFFVEAKKPSVNVKDDIHPAYQLRRYAWSAKLSLSILTDFEELAVYDCRILPNKTDKASTGRVFYFNYKDYLSSWDELSSIFSRDAILKGSFDKFAESNKSKRGTAEVDDTFLKVIEEWRFTLARNFALRNPSLTTRELNFAVQKTIDRIIFLRICEDRGIEEYGQLMALQNGENAYQRLLQIFKRADEKYNSGLFHFDDEKEREESPDELTPSLSVDDKILKEIFGNLYYPESPFEFSVLPADILGQVYEQFLGKVIRLTESHQAKVEDKPEVKKAGGVYYTPTYIVEYIVENTLGKLITEAKNISPKQISAIKILDPACGSGSFLIVAYQYLLDWHLLYYTQNDEQSGAALKKNLIYHTHTGDYRLTTSERKRILLNNIYGVDIDPQAVEVTKLSLLLKVLEGESEQTLTTQTRMFRERALPDLGSNIKCGNSLIGPDFYDQMEMNFLDDEEKLRINVFDWNNEFKEIMNKGGFDVVIGNPPYVRQELISRFKNYFERIYKVYNGVADLYQYFIERAVTLLKENGYFSYIVANKWMRANYGKPLREWLKVNGLIEIIDFGDLPVFKRATTYPCIITVNKGSEAGSLNIVNVKDLSFIDLKEYAEENKIKIKKEDLGKEGWALISSVKNELLNKLYENSIPLGKYVEGKIYYGIKTGLNIAFIIDKATKDELINEDPKSAEIIKPFLMGRDIIRYAPFNVERYLIFTRRGIKIDDYPAVKNYLREYKDALMPKPKGWKGNKWQGRKPGSYQWFELQDTVDYYKEFEKPKIIVPAIVQTANYTFDVENYYSNDKTTIIQVDDTFLLGLLNSKLLDFVMHSIASTKQGGYYEYKPMYLVRLPIYKDINNEIKKEITDLADRMIKLNKSFNSSRTPQEKTALQRQIEATDKQIDYLVYRLYGLTDEEIKIVEEK